MGALSREAFDAIEFDAACTGDHRAAAQQMTMLADTGTQTAAMPRAEAYVRAGEQWLLADDPAAAATTGSSAPWRTVAPPPPTRGSRWRGRCSCWAGRGG